MWRDVAEYLVEGELVLLPLDHHILHAAVVAGLARPQGLAEPAGPDVAAQEQRVVGVGGAHLVCRNEG